MVGFGMLAAPLRCRVFNRSQPIEQLRGRDVRRRASRSRSPFGAYLGGAFLNRVETLTARPGSGSTPDGCR